MKLTRRQFQLLIEKTLNEENTAPKIRARTEEDDIQAITDYRKGGSRGSFPPIGFGDEKGINTVSQYMHEPDLADVAAVDKYRLEKKIGDKEISAFDDEYTNPYGFAQNYTPKSSSSTIDYDYSKNYNDSQALDSSKNVETFEDEDGAERTYMDGKEVTPGAKELEPAGTIESLRNYFKKFLEK